jgi:predicted SAM-dependent methyltransferase
MDGYINCDLFNPKAQEKWDAAKLPVADGAVDEIHSSHLIEHFHFYHGQDVIREWIRALRSGGTLVIETPNFQASCEKFIKLPPEQQHTMFGHFFAKPWLPGEVHMFLYTPAHMMWTLKELGMINILQVPALRYPEDQDQNMKFTCQKP